MLNYDVQQRPAGRGLLLNYRAPTGIVERPAPVWEPDFIGVEIIPPAGGSTDWTQNLDDVLTLSDALAQDYGMALDDVLSLVDAVAKAYGLSEADVITLTDLATEDFTSWLPYFRLLLGVG